jgi:hypothetical protein
MIRIEIECQKMGVHCNDWELRSQHLAIPDQKCQNVSLFGESPSSRRPRTPRFQCGNTGSNPVGDAKTTRHPQNIRVFNKKGERAVAALLWHSIKSDLLTSAPKVTEYGRERTELVKQEGRWLISNRVVLSESGMPEGLIESYPEL